MLKMMHSITYMVENNYGAPITVDLDCSKSSGYSFMPPSGKVRRRMEPGQCEYLMQLCTHLGGALNNIINQEEITVSLSS